MTQEQLESDAQKIADAHARADWESGRRWTCPCGICKAARDQRYEPKSSGWIKTPEQSRTYAR
jgi:hypothetical protein